MITKNCSNCSSEFSVTKSRVDTAKYCSRSCMTEGVKKKSNANCAVCGVGIKLKPSYINKLKHHPCCSRECLGVLRREIYLGKNNPNYGNTGDSNPKHKGYRTKHVGYYWVYVPDHPFSLESNGRIREHRLIAEKHHLTESNSVEIDGLRYLHHSFDVHHINGDKFDNRPENLEVITRGEHTRHHNLESPAPRGQDGKFTAKAK